MYPFIKRNLIPREIIDYTKVYIDVNWDKFIPNGHGRQYLKFNSMSDLNLFSVKVGLGREFGFKDWVIDPWYNDFIGFQIEGGAVHPHTDPSSDGRAHTRINVLISKPEQGGMPLLDGREVQVDVGDVWLNLASTCVHSSTPVVGAIPRVVLSFGMQVIQSEIDPIYTKYVEWFSKEPK